MANQKRTIDYEIQFRTNQLSLQNVNKVFRLFFDNFKFSDLLLINNSTKDKATKDLLEIRETANTVEAALTAAFNPKLGITNIDTFKNNLKAAGTSIEQVRAAFDKAGGAGTLAFLAMANSLTNVRLKATESESIIDKMGETLKRTLTWSISSSIINKMAGSIQEAYGYVKHLDTSLNDIRIVTEYSAEAMDKFAEKANKAAITLGKSTTDYTEAALIYYQQGLGEEDVAARTDVTLKTANVTQQSTALVSEELTAIWNGYKVNAEEAEAYIDKVAKVAAVTAADLEEMATGMSKVASAANVMGVDIDLMNAILATTISVTRQAPESVGAAYKTIFARMSLIQAGEETEDGATLKSYTEQMAAMGVSVLDANNKLRDMGDIIEEVGNKWSSWGREQQIAFAQVAAGTRQYNNLIALFDNWGMYEKTLEESKNALGTLLTQQDIYMESTAAHLQQLRTAAEGVYDSLINAKDINSVVDVFTKWTKGIESVVDGLGGLKGVLGVIGPLIINAFSSNIGQIMSLGFSNFTVKAENKEKIELLIYTLNELEKVAPEASKKYIESMRALANNASGMNPDDFNKIALNIERQGRAIGELAAKEQEAKNIEKDFNIAKEEAKKATEEKIAAENKLTQAQEKLAKALQEQIRLQEELNKLRSDKTYSNDLVDAAKRYVLSYSDTRRTTGTTQEERDANKAFNEIDKKRFAALASAEGEEGTLANAKAIVAEYEKRLQNAEKIKDLETEIKNNEHEIASAGKEIVNTELALEDAKDKEANAAAKVEELENEHGLALMSVVEKQALLNSLKSEGLRIQKEEVRHLGEGLALFTSGIAGIGNAIKSFSSIRNIWNKTDISDSEKMLLITTVLGTAVGGLVFGIDRLKTGWSNMIKGMLGVKTLLLTMTAQHLLETGAILAETGATMADVIAKNAEALSIKNVTAAMLTLIKVFAIAHAGIIAIVAVVGALVAAYLAAQKAMHQEQKALEEANEALKERRQILSEINDKTNNFKSLTDTLKEELEALKQTIKGTSEWNDALEKVNNTVNELLETYPELYSYTSYQNGLKIISEEGLEEYYKKLLNKLALALIGVLSGNISVEDLLVSAAEEAARRSYGKANYGSYFGSLFGDTPGGDLVYSDIHKSELEIRKQIAELEAEAAKNNAYYDKEKNLKAIKYWLDVLAANLELLKAEENRLNLLKQEVELLNSETISNWFEDFKGTESTANLLEKYVTFLAALSIGAISQSVYADLNSNTGFAKNVENSLYYQKAIAALSERTGLYNWEYSKTDAEGNKGNFVKSGDTYVTFDTLSTIFAEKQVDVAEMLIWAADNQGKVLKRNLENGISTIDELTLELINAIKSISDETNAEALLKKFDEYELQIKNDLATKTERLGYATAAENITDWDALTFELKKLIADKIHEAFKDGGSEGVQNLVLQMKDTDFEAAVQLTVKTPEEDLALALKDAGVKQEDYDAEVAYRSALGESYDSQDLINYLAALKELNNIYKDRSNIFSSLANFKWETANGQLKEYLISLKLTFSTLTGKDISFDFILNNLNLIEDYIEGVDGAASKLNGRLKALSISEITETKDKIDAAFKDYSPENGDRINSDLEEFINELAEKLGYNEELLRELYKAYGYEWDEDKSAYIYHQKYGIKTESIDDLYNEYNIYAEEKKKLGEEVESFKDWLSDNGWSRTGDFEYTLFYNLNNEVNAKTYWNKKESYHLTEDEVKKVLEAIPEETLIDLGGHKIDENNWVLECDYTTLIKLRTIFEENGSEIPDFLGGGSYTALEINEVYKPKLDTSDIDRGLERILLELDEVKEASKFLSGDALVANLQQLIDLETQLLEKKKEKIAREELYQKETASAYNLQMLNYNSGLTAAEKISGESFSVNVGFVQDSEGFIKNLNEIDKAYFDEEQKIENAIKTASGEAKEALQDLLKIIKDQHSETTSYISTINSSREKSIAMALEEAKYAKTVAELELLQAMVGADRTAATTSQLADLEYQAEKTSKALENLGDAGDLSGSALIKYNETRIGLLEQLEKEAEEKLKILAEERQRLLGDAENANSLMGLANKLGVDIQFREDGSVNLDAMKADWQEIQDSLKYSNEELAEMGRIWQVIEKYGKNYNSNLDENNKSIEDWVKNEKEIARLSASMKYAEINTELEDAAKKAGILKQNLEHAKAVFDKAGDNKKNFVKDYIESLEEYDKVQEAVLKRSAERFEKLKQDWNPKSDTTALSAAFNAEDMESFMAVYGEALLELIELDKELEKELAETQASMSNYVTAEELQSKEYIDLVKKAEKLKQAQDLLEKSTDDLADKYEHLSSKMADMSQVADLSKEWKTAAVDREIKKVNRELSLLQKQQSRLKGKDVITNLQQQVAVIQKQINLEKNKLKILQAQALTQRVLIQEMITQMQLQGLGSAFDSSGHVNAAFLDKLAKKADLANEKVLMIISALKDYESIMNEIESLQDAIVSLQDEIADKQYEISEKIYEETRKEAEKLLNKFKIEIEVELNEAEMMRKIDRLRAKVAAMPAWDLAGAMGLDIGDAVSYATKDVDILTNAVNKLIVDYQSDAWKDFYDTLKDAYDDIISYANQLTSAVESFYDALDTARLKYSEAIDKVISANQELIDDLEEMKKISKHGINITKMLFGENSYEDLTTYYKKIQNTTRELLLAAKEQAAYYKALLATIDPMKHPDEYESVKSALKSAIDETYAYAEEMGNQALEEMNAKIEDAARKLKDEFARVLGYENSTMQDLAHDYQLKILKDYLDTTESLYEMVTLLNKFTKAINDTTNASEKSKLSKVMKEQVGYLQQLVEKTGRLTKYEVDRANMMYDLTLKLMALEEARDNKTKMRLRRDSQGNYRYEYVADAEKTAEAQQDLLEQQYKIYELDKKRLLELYDEKEKLIEEFNLKLIDILNNQYLTEAEKELAVNELKEQYYGENGYLIQLGRDYAEAVHNIDESADGELDKILEDIIEETGRTSEEIQNNFIDVANAMDNFANEGLAALDLYTTGVLDALASLTDGLGDLEATIDMDINTIMELADVDLELIDVWIELVDVCGDLMAQLEELEEYYRGVMLAALDAAEAAAKLKVTDFSTADERKKDTLTGNAAAQGTVSPSNNTANDASAKKETGKKGSEAPEEVKYLVLINPNNPSDKMIGPASGTNFFTSEQIAAIAREEGVNSSRVIGTSSSWSSIKKDNLYKKWTKGTGIAEFDTGGYTGEWGNNGRLAMLHLKELILNQRDTANLLSAVDIMRTLQDNIEQILNYANTISPNFNVSAPSSDLNQNVKIEASFPGVTNSREIEDAFNNLVNLASQRAMSTRR